MKKNEIKEKKNDGMKEYEEVIKTLRKRKERMEKDFKSLMQVLDDLEKLEV